MFEAALTSVALILNLGVSSSGGQHGTPGLIIQTLHNRYYGPLHDCYSQAPPGPLVAGRAGRAGRAG